MPVSIAEVCCQCEQRDQIHGLRVCFWEVEVNPNLRNRMVGRLCGACATTHWAQPICVMESVAHEDIPPWAD